MDTHGASAHKQPAHRDDTIPDPRYCSVTGNGRVPPAICPVSYSLGMMIHIRT